MVLRQLIQHQKDRRGVVVDDNRRRAEKFFQQLPGVDIALAPLTLPKFILQIAVPSSGSPDRLDGPLRKRRPSKVGVENYPGGIDHLSERGLPASLEPLSDSLLDVFTYVAAPLRRRSVVPEAIANSCTGFPERLPNFGHHQFSGVSLEPFLDTWSAQQVIHRGKILVALFSLGRFHVLIAAPPRESRQCHDGSSSVALHECSRWHEAERTNGRSWTAR